MREYSHWEPLDFQLQDCVRKKKKDLHFNFSWCWFRFSVQLSFCCPPNLFLAAAPWIVTLAQRAGRSVLQPSEGLTANRHNRNSTNSGDSWKLRVGFPWSIWPSVTQAVQFSPSVQSFLMAASKYTSWTELFVLQIKINL